MELPDIDEENAKLQQNDLPDLDEANAALQQQDDLPDLDEANAALEQKRQPVETASAQQQGETAVETPQPAATEQRPDTHWEEVEAREKEFNLGDKIMSAARGLAEIGDYLKTAKEARFGKELSGFGAVMANTPVVGTNIEAEQNRQMLMEEKLARGEFSNTLEMSRAALTLGIPQETIKQINDAAAGDVDAARQLFSDLVMDDYQKRQETRDLKSRQATEQEKKLNWAQKQVAGAVGVTETVVNMSGIAAPFTIGADASNRAARLHEAGADGNSAMIKGLAGAEAERLIWGAKLLKYVPFGDKIARYVGGGAGKWLTKNVAELLGMVAKTRLVELVDDVGGMKVHDGVNVETGENQRTLEEWAKDSVSLKKNAELLVELLPVHFGMKAVSRISPAGLAAAKTRKARAELLERYGVEKDRIGKLSDEDIDSICRFLADPNLTEDKFKRFVDYVARDADAGAEKLAAAVDMRVAAKEQKFTPEQEFAIDQIAPQFNGDDKMLNGRVKERIREKLADEAVNGTPEGQTTLRERLDDPAEMEAEIMKATEEVLMADNYGEISKSVNAQSLGTKADDRATQLLTAMPRTADKAESRIAGEIAAADPEMSADRVWEVAQYLAAHGGEAGQPLTKERIAEIEKEIVNDKAGVVPVEQPDGTFKTVNEVEAEAAREERKLTSDPETKVPGDKLDRTQSQIQEHSGKRGQVKPNPVDQAMADGGAKPVDHSADWTPVEGKSGTWHTAEFPDAEITLKDAAPGEGENPDGTPSKIMFIDNLPDPATLDEAGQLKLGKYLSKRLEEATKLKVKEVNIGTPEQAEEYQKLVDKYEQKVNGDKFQVRADGVIGILKKSGLASDVIATEEEFNAKLASYGQNGQRLIADGKTYGFTDGTNVYLNPAFFRTKIGLNTPIHEFGHLAIIATKKVNKAVYDRALQLIKETEYWKEVGEHPDYASLPEWKRAEEALARLIAERGERLEATTPKGVVAEIKKLLVEIWKSFGNALGIRDLTPEKIEKMSVEDIADAIRAEMTSGREFGTRELSLAAGDVKAKILRFSKYRNPNGKAAKASLKAVKDAWKSLSEEEKARIGEYGDTDVLRSPEAKRIADMVEKLRGWDAQRKKMSEGAKRQARQNPNAGQQKIVTGSPEYYVANVTEDMTSPFAFVLKHKIPIPQKGDFGYDAWRNLTDGMDKESRRELARFFGGKYYKHGGTDLVMRDYAEFLGMDLKSADEFELKKGAGLGDEGQFEQFLADVMAEKAKFEEWRAGDRKTRAEMEAERLKAEAEGKTGMTDEEFAEELAWVQAAEANRVEAERRGEQNEIDDMPDFSRASSPMAVRENVELSKRFGNWEQYANLPKSATSYADVRTILTKEVKKNFTNRSSGLMANLSSNSINKILSGKAVAKSVNLKVHLKAAANIIQLFENGRLFITEDGKKKGVVKSNKIFCPFKSEGETYIAKITVHEYQGQDHRIYSVEAMDVQKAGSILAPKDGSHQADSPTLPSDVGNVAKSDSSVNGGILLSRGGLSEAGRTPVSEEEFSRLEKEFGTTRYMSEAGYILPNGKLLDLSGRKQGYSGKDHSRHLDHRELTDVIVRTDGNDAMQDVIASGAIRIGPESGVIDLGNLPNARQKDVLWDFIDRFNGEVTVDFRLPNGNNDGGAAYREGTSARRILQDIEKYFADGTLPEGTAEETMFSRGERARLVGGRTRVAADEDHGERTPGGLAAARELAAVRNAPVNQLGTRRFLSLDISSLEELRKIVSEDVRPAHVAKTQDGVARTGGQIAKGNVAIWSDTIGVTDHTDAAAEKANLKQHGFFRDEDPNWCMGQSDAAIRAERNRSEQQLGRQLEALGERRIRGLEPGGQTAERGVFADEVAKVVLAQKRRVGGRLGRLQTIGKSVQDAVSRMPGMNQADAEWSARRFLDWAYGRPDYSQNMTGRELTAEMFGKWLVMPRAVEQTCPEWANAIEGTIAADPKLADAFRTLADRRLNGDEYLMRRLRKQMDRQTEEALRELKAEKDEEIGVGSKWRNWEEKALFALHDTFAPVYVRMDYMTRVKIKAMKAAIRAANPADRPALRQQLDLYMGDLGHRLKQLELSRTAYERGTINEGSVYHREMVRLENEAHERWGLTTEDMSLYLDQWRVIETGGRSASFGEDVRQARKALDDMETRLGPEKWRRMREYGNRFFAIHERELLNDPRAERMFGKAFVDYLRTQTHYVATERTFSVEELDAIEVTRRALRNAGVRDVDDVISQMFDYAGSKGAGEAIGEKDWTGRQTGSMAAKTEVRAATFKKVDRLQRALRRNQFVLDLREALTFADVTGVRDLPRKEGAKYPEGSRYGHINYLENGEKRTLVVPKHIADAFKGDPAKTKWWSTCVRTIHNAWRAVIIDYNPSYRPMNIRRNIASIEKNMPGMRETWAKTVLRGTFPGAGALSDLVFDQMVKRIPASAKLFSDHTYFYYIPQMERICKIIENPSEWQQKYWDALDANDLGKISQMDADWNMAKEMLRANMFVSIRSAYANEKSTSFAAEALAKKGLKTLEEIDRQLKSRTWKQKGIDKLLWAFRKSQQLTEHDDMMAKGIAYLADRTHYGLVRTAKESGDLVNRRVSIAQGERRGAAAGTLKMLVPFYNMIEKGVVRHWDAYRTDFGHTLAADSKFVIGSACSMLMAKGLAQLWMLRNADNDEEKARKKFGLFYDYAKAYHDAYRNCSEYVRKNYSFTPLWTDGYTSVILGGALTDEEKLLNPIVDFTVGAIAASEGLEKMPSIGSTFLDMTVRSVVPDLQMTGPLVEGVRLAFNAIAGENYEDYFRGTMAFDQKDLDMRFESWEDFKDFSAAVGGRAWNYYGGRTMLEAPVAGVDNGRGTAPESLETVLKRIPWVSPVINRMVKIQVGSPERDGAAVRARSKEGNNAIEKCAERLLKMREGDVGWHERHPKEYEEKLAEWQKTYGLSDHELKLVRARYLNALNQVKCIEKFDERKRKLIKREAKRQGCSEELIYIQLGER